MQDWTVIHGVVTPMFEAVEEELPGNEGMLELNNLVDDKNLTHDYITNNLMIAPSRSLFDFQTVRHGGLPLALCPRSGECSNKVFLDFFSSMHRHPHQQEMVTITNITDLSDKKLVYSRDGWLLFSRPSTTNGVGTSLFVHNIITGEYIGLPDIKGTRRGRDRSVSVFSTSASSVDYVIHVDRDSLTRETTIYVTRPDTGSWEVYSKKYERDPRCRFRIRGRHEIVGEVMFGNKVYMFDRSGIIDVFDLAESRWWSMIVTDMPASQWPDSHVTEVDGKIVKIYAPNEEQNRYRFSKLDWDDEYGASWVQMSESELENKSWFLNYRYAPRALCVKGLGVAAVYQFTRQRQGHAMNIRVYDLKTGIARELLPFPVFLSAMGQWVDLGD